MYLGFISHTLIITSIIALMYIVLIALELNHNNRIASNFRLYLDTKISLLLKEVFSFLRSILKKYEDGVSTFESDIINQISRPFSNTQKKYKIMKTGIMDIRDNPNDDKSKYFTELLSKKKRGVKKVIKENYTK